MLPGRASRGTHYATGPNTRSLAMQILREESDAVTPTPVPSYRERKWRCSSLSSARSTPYITSVLRFASTSRGVRGAGAGGDRGIRYIRGINEKGKRDAQGESTHGRTYTIRVRTGDGAGAGWKRKGGRHGVMEEERGFPREGTRGSRGDERMRNRVVQQERRENDAGNAYWGRIKNLIVAGEPAPQKRCTEYSSTRYTRRRKKKKISKIKADRSPPIWDDKPKRDM
ncbi:hypothetical protein BJV74DRAFT_902578 [Russula compacta]|nr:hypothetical protein BJV74DRAFT_902578 [Russula compacta]